MKKLHVLPWLLSTAVVSTLARGQQLQFVEDLLPQAVGGVDSAAGDGDWFGLGSRFSNGFKGSATLYSRQAKGWVEHAVLEAPDGDDGDAFGIDLAMSGGTLVVGASNDSNQNGLVAGAAYVFVLSGNQWVSQGKLVASNGKPNHKFGHTVAVSGDTIAVGSVGGNTVYVFERSGSTWSEVLKFSFGVNGLGRSVAIDGDRLVAGAWLADPLGIGTTGGVYVYERGPTEWALQEILVHDDPVPGDNTGWDVDVEGDCIVATDIETGTGRAFVFRKVAGMWMQEVMLLPQDGMAGDDFGRAATLRGSYAVITDDPPAQRGPESLFLFRRSGTSWTPESKVPTTGSLLSVDIEGNRLVVGGLVDHPGGNGAIYVIPEGPDVYCTGKASSLGCVPQITASGSPTLTGADDFAIGAVDVLPSRPGLFFFGTLDSAALPFFGGTLCVLPPLRRTAVQLSSSGTACNGTYSFLFSQAVMLQAGLLPADRIYGQYWARDPAHPDGTGVSLSNAMQVILLP